MPSRRAVLPIALWVCGALLTPGGLPAQAAPGPRHEPDLRTESVRVAGKLHTYFTAAARTLDPRPQRVLRSIPNRTRRMLAVTHYLRGRHRVDTLWTWSREETRAYQRTELYRRAMADLRRVRRTFAALNPGYVLVADTTRRSLPRQVLYWNRERSVAAAAQELQDSCRVWLSGDSYPDVPDSASLARFLDRVAGYAPTRLPTVAVPGLSLHGQIRAIDFAILHRGRMVAGTSSATIDSVWDRGGWTERLRQAVALAATDLVGPLQAPREPWHYEYRDRRILAEVLAAGPDIAPENAARMWGAGRPGSSEP
jgi:hypothetical protein